MTKRFFTLLLALIMCVSLAACGGDDEKEKNDKTDADRTSVEENEENTESNIDKILKKVARKETTYYDDAGYYNDLGRAKEQLFYDKNDVLVYKLAFTREGYAVEWCEFDANGVVLKCYEYGEAGTWQIAQENETDKDGNVTKYTRYSEGSVYTIEEYTYKDGKLVKEEGIDPEDGEITISKSYEYDPAGRLIKTAVTSYGEDYSYSEYTYNGAGKLIEENIVYISNSDKNGQIIYEYDGNGNVIKEVSSYNSRYKTFTYDEQNRLLKINEVSPAGDIYFVESYTYDSNGNMLTKTDAGRTTTEYDSTGKIIKKSSGDYFETYKYDASGNLTEVLITDNGEIRCRYSMEYDSTGNQLKWAVEDYEDAEESFSYSYEYDENGFRIKTTSYDKDGNVMS